MRRSISARTRDRLRALYELYAAGAPLREVHEELAVIVHAGEALAIGSLLALTLAPRRGLAEAVGDAIAALRAQVSARDLAALDHGLRAGSLYMPADPPGSGAWQQMAPAALAGLAALSAGPTLLQLAMSHRSGYVREEAVRRAALASDGGEVPVLLLRANDWVLAVRARAAAALAARMGDAHLPDLVAALPLVDLMRAWPRLPVAPTLDEIDAHMRAPAALPALRAAAASPDRDLRRAALRRWLAQEPVDAARAALADPEPAIRAWVGRWLAAAPPEIFAPFCDALLRHASGGVRFFALHRLRALGGLTLDLLSPRLLDPHADTRALAQTAALDAGAVPDEDYRRHVATARGARLAVALVGLAETGGPADAAAIRAHLTSAIPVVRRGALRALATLHVDDVALLARQAAEDPSPSVRRAGHALLRARGPRQSR